MRSGLMRSLSRCGFGSCFGFRILEAMMDDEMRHHYLALVDKT
jgi:hypothetical protein